MTHVLRIVVLSVVLAVGCRSTPTEPSYTDLRGTGKTSPIRNVSHDELPERSAVELEPEQPAADSSSWKRFLSPFGRPKKRIPLPLSPRPSDPGADETSDEF